MCLSNPAEDCQVCTPHSTGMDKGVLQSRECWMYPCTGGGTHVRESEGLAPSSACIRCTTDPRASQFYSPFSSSPVSSSTLVSDLSSSTSSASLSSEFAFSSQEIVSALDSSLQENQSSSDSKHRLNSVNFFLFLR